MEKRIHIIEKGKQWKNSGLHTLDVREIAHPVDKTLIKALEIAHVKDILETPLQQLVAANYGQIIATGITLDENNFPQLYCLMEDTCRKLGIKIPYTVISNELSGINAFATGTDSHAYIVISNMAARFLKPEELKFIISHECGHIVMEHMVYHTAGSLAAAAGGYVPIIGPALASTVVFPLNCWNRCSEITADRIGLICCEDLHVAQMALLRIVGGCADIEEIDVERYIVKSRYIQDVQPLGKLAEYFQTHPMIYKRLKALELFYHSEAYFQVSGKNPPGDVKLLNKAELDAKTSELLKIL